MPFASEKQRRFLWAKHPDVARKFAEHTPMKQGKFSAMVSKKKHGKKAKKFGSKAY